MPRGCWRTLFLVTSYALLVAGARESQPHFILHNDSAIQYSEFNPNGDHSICSTDGACQNQWWVEDNETGNSKVSQDEHATRGPGVWLALGLRGTKTLALQGKPDGDAQKGISVVFKGSDGSHIGPLNAKGSSDGKFFSTTKLDPDISYTMNMSYTGKDFLRIVGVLIDSGGKFNFPGQEPSPTPTAPTTPGEGAPSSQTSLTTNGGASLPSSGANGTGSPSGIPATAGLSVTPSAPTGASPGPSLSGSSSDSGHTPHDAYSAPSSHSSGPEETPAAGGSTVGTPGSGTNDVGHGKRNGALIGGIVAGVLILLLLLALLYLYLRRRQRARRAPSYPFRARGFQFRKEVEHWTDRPISPIVPTSGDWESFAFPPETDEEGARKVSERRSTLSSRMGIAL